MPMDDIRSPLTSGLTGEGRLLECAPLTLRAGLWRAEVVFLLLTRHLFLSAGAPRKRTGLLSAVPLRGTSGAARRRIRKLKISCSGPISE
jgi:hypothetical protein